MIDLKYVCRRSHESTTQRGILDKYKTVSALKKATAAKVIEETMEFIYSLPVSEFDKDSEQSEIADIVLTLCTYCYDREYDIEKAIGEKLAYNCTRHLEEMEKEPVK